MITLLPEALRAKNYLKTHHVVVPDEWLAACIEFLHEESSGQLIPQDTLNTSVYEQWRDSDLHMLQTSCLPENVESTKTTLNGYFVLQVDEVIDVSQPAYQQLCKLRGTENANMFVSADPPVKKEPKLSRMLILKLTDGTRTVQGMEYRPIAGLNVNTKPGSKILIHGQIRCREGMLLLTKDVVTVLGGEVDNMTETNSPTQVLVRTLGQEDTLAQPDPPNIPAISSRTNTTNHVREVVTSHIDAPIVPVGKRARLATSSSEFHQRVIPSSKPVGSSSVEPITIDDSNDGFPDDDDLFPEPADYDWAADEMDIDESEDFQTHRRSESPVFNSSANTSGSSIKPPISTASSSSSLRTNVSSLKNAVDNGTIVKKSNEVRNGQAAKRLSLTLSKHKQDTVSDNKSKPLTLDNFFTSKSNPKAPTSSVQSSTKSSSKILARTDSPSDDWDDDFDLDESSFSNQPLGVPKLATGNSAADHAQSVKKLDSRPLIRDMRSDTSTSDTSEGDILRPRSARRVPIVIDDDDDDEDDLVAERFSFTTIAEIKRQSSVTPATQSFRVRGFIAGITSTLKTTESGWNLSARICDGTGHLEVILANPFLEPLIGLKAQNRQALKAIAKEDPGYKEKLRQAAISCQVKLMNLCAFLELMCPPNETPSLVGFSPVTANTLLTLMKPKRLSQSSGILQNS